MQDPLFNEYNELEYYPYDKYKSPHTETPTSNLGVGGGGTLESNTQSAKICLNFNFFFWGGGGTLESNTQSAKICLNSNFRGGGGGLSGQKFQRGALWRIFLTDLLFTQKPACPSQIVSHILRIWRLISWLSNESAKGENREREKPWDLTSSPFQKVSYRTDKLYVTLRCNHIIIAVFTSLSIRTAHIASHVLRCISLSTHHEHYISPATCVFIHS